MNRSPSLPPVLWTQVLGLTAVQIAISLMWIIYGAYLPQLLGEFQIPPEIGLVLLIVENGLAIAFQPIMGALSDRSLHWMGTRFPFISVGVVLASALFLAIPLLAFVKPVSTLMQWLIIFVLIAWSLAMVAFQSPVFSLLIKYAAVPALPLASSLLTTAAALAGVLRPSVNQFILSFGPLTTFLVGSIVLLGAAMALRAVDLSKQPPSPEPLGGDRLSWAMLLLIGGVGISVGWGNRLMIDSFGKVFRSQLPEANIERLMMWVFIGLALMAVPGGLVATRFGNRRTIITALIGAIAASQLMPLMPNGILLGLCVTVVIFALGIVLNGAFPLVLSLLPIQRAGLAIGMYLGGGAAAVTIFAMLFNNPDQIAIGQGLLMVAIAFILAIGCLLWSYRLQPASPSV